MMPTLCRLEYLTRHGWVVGHANVALLNPEGYVARLEARGKVGRCTDVTDPLKDGQVWVSSLVPDPDNIPASIFDRLVYRDNGNPRVPTLQGEDEECEFCLGTMCDGDGSCLL